MAKITFAFVKKNAEQAERIERTKKCKFFFRVFDNRRIYSENDMPEWVATKYDYLNDNVDVYVTMRFGGDHPGVYGEGYTKEEDKFCQIMLIDCGDEMAEEILVRLNREEHPTEIMEELEEQSIKKKAWETAGWRERYAMENGKAQKVEDDRGHVLWTYSYSAARDYQDANGAVYDATENRWIN